MNRNFSKKPSDKKFERSSSRSTRSAKPTNTYGRKHRRDDDDDSKPRFRDNDEKPRRRTVSRDNDFDKKPRFRDNDENRPSRFSDNKFERKPRTAKPFDKSYDKPRRKVSAEQFEDIKPTRKKSTIKELTGETRLNKFIANSGICSRREADNYITAGVVSVNGTVITEMGFQVKPGDDVRFNGERIKGETKVYLIMNKPKNFVTTTGDPHAEKTVMDLIGDKCTQRVFPVGRLDKNTTGVLLFTNDGELTEKLTHPSYNKKKIYDVHLNRKVKVADLRKLVEGIELEDGIATADHVEYVGAEKNEVGLEIHSGRNRVVRRMFEALGYTVEALDRVYFAGLTKKNLKRGQWRFLNEGEINMLRLNTYE